MKPLTLSIVIPVYNEELHVQACLEAIAAQSVMPEEVIVVDNNCTDGTIAIAQRFDFVKVIKQPRQGLIASRNLGFERSHGNIMARINADSRLEPDWAEHLKMLFAEESVDAVGGPALTKTLWQDWVPRTRLWSLIYYWWTEAEFGIPILWGSNMAIRRSAWDAIKDEACIDDRLVHEDQDLSFLLAGHGKKVVRSNDLLIKTDEDSYHNWQKFREYYHRRKLTKRRHRKLRTLANKDVNKLSIAERLLRLGGVVLPGIAFLLTSPLLYFVKLVLPKKVK